jgi:F-type H+-transporting ATPase subunit b
MKFSGSSRKGTRAALSGGFAAMILSGGSAYASGIAVIPDGSTIIQIINFIFLIWALNIVLYKPIRGILKQRAEKISSMEKGIESADRDAQEKESAFADGIKAARAKGQKEKEALVDEGLAEEKKLVQEINSKAQADLAAIRETIAKEADAARTALQAEVEVFATAIGEKILGRAV